MCESRRVDGDGLVGRPLFFEPFRLVCPAEHPLQATSTVRLDELDRDGLLLLEEGHCLRDQALALCGNRGARDGARFASSLEMLRHMIAAGEGYSLLPLLATSGRPELELLTCTREVADAAAGRVVGLLWRSSDPRQAEFRELAEFLQATAPPGTQSEN